MHRISKTFQFEAAHRLATLPPEHKCSHRHGHSYTVQVVVAAERLTGPGFVVDFGELRPLRRYLAETFDHRDLNDVLDVEPTSENLAHHLFHWCAEHLVLPKGAHVERVRVSETASTWAEYAPDGGTVW
ncbi:6-carboxytetrahydropterin synthase QueD [Microtetraspora malaysiensis]|uniref:6-carboxy-5,6,7,8-tetrahydropterin synthase n=1 Tax=Microtetraspora malaysiensis TaxID=161358 RepID=A0ABW6SP14_9ACTN